MFFEIGSCIEQRVKKMIVVSEQFSVSIWYSQFSGFVAKNIMNYNILLLFLINIVTFVK
jgi:hypothetical protein